MREGEYVSTLRKTYARRDYTVTKTSLVASQLGCAGEIAVSKYLEIEWIGMSQDRHDPDVGLDCEVRTTDQQWGSLLLNQRDMPKAGRRFVLVKALGSLRFHLVGWQYGYHVMVDHHIFERAHFKERVWRYPTGELRPVQQLRPTATEA